MKVPEVGEDGGDDDGAHHARSALPARSLAQPGTLAWRAQEVISDPDSPAMMERRQDRRTSRSATKRRDHQLGSSREAGGNTRRCR
jgi:hypothetical protein